MKKFSLGFISIVLFSCSLFGSGSSGSFEIMLGVMENKTNGVNAPLFKKAKNKKIESLNDKKKSVSFFFLFPKFSYQYSLNKRNHFGIGASKGKDIGFFYQRDLENSGFVLSYTPSFSKSWQDPFLINKDRETGKTESHTFSFQYKNQFITPKIFYKNETQHKDKTLTYKDLGRSGKELGVTLSKSFGLITPSLTYSSFKALGKSDSYVYKGADFSFVYPFFEGIQIITNGGLAQNNYKKEHSLFGKKREDKTFSFGGFVIVNTLFETKGRYLSIGGMGSKTNSNIDFFDTESRLFFVGVGQRF